MTFTLRVNARNDVHLTTKVIQAMNLGKEKLLKAEIKDDRLILIPVDLEPRYSKKALEGLKRLHKIEKKKGLIHVKSSEDIDRVLKS